MNFTAEETSNSSAAEIGIIDHLRVSVFFIHFLVGLPTHSYVIGLIVTGSGFAAEFFILNLSVCEIGICLNRLFHVISVLATCSNNLQVLLQGFVITGRPLFQCLMCVERFLAVVHPVTFLKLKPLRYRIFCCSVAWSFTLASCLCCILFVQTLDDYIFTWTYSIQYIFFILIQFLCLVSVLLVLKQSGPGERKEENRRKRRAFYLILVITLSMCFTYVPFIISAFWYLLTSQSLNGLWFMSSCFYILAGFVHSYLYLKSSRKLACCQWP